MKFLALGEIVEILDSKRRPISKKDRIWLDFNAKIK